MTDWSALDFWMAFTAAVAAMSCALPGALLVLRRQSLMGDALSHSTLPGIVLAFLALHQLRALGWVSRDVLNAAQPAVLFVGAALTGIGCGVLSEVLKRWGRLEPTAALGVVYTSLFALGLLLIRAAADQVHFDAGCVLYGNLETVVTDTVDGSGLPRAAVTNGVVLLVNAVLLALFYKELQLSTFDPDLAQALGFPAGWLHLGLLAATGATIVAAFESVGSILVIAMLIVPPATAVLLSNRLSGVLWCSVGLAAVSAFLGHALALGVPSLLQRVLHLPGVEDVSTAGMMAMTSGLLFVLAWILAPGHGLIRQKLNQFQLQMRILSEDILGVLYRVDELGAEHVRAAALAATLRARPWRVRWGLRALQRRGLVATQGSDLQLTPAGRDRGRELVRSHRLWEAYLAKHFALPDRQLHAAAEAAEHYLHAAERAQLDVELQQPGQDPHGRTIPEESKP